MQAKEGDKVKVHYTGTFETDEVFDSSRGKEPLEFIVGSGQVIPGFDNGVKGLAVNESKIITIAPEDAYGIKQDQLVFTINKSKLPADLTPEVGQQLGITSEDGKQAAVWITAINENAIVLDGNHPLAGKTLIFDIELVEILPSN